MFNPTLHCIKIWIIDCFDSCYTDKFYVGEMCISHTLLYVFINLKKERNVNLINAIINNKITAIFLLGCFWSPYYCSVILKKWWTLQFITFDFDYFVFAGVKPPSAITHMLHWVAILSFKMNRLFVTHFITFFVVHQFPLS